MLETRKWEKSFAKSIDSLGVGGIGSPSDVEPLTGSLDEHEG